MSRIDICPNCEKLKKLVWAGFCSRKCEQEYDNFIDRITRMEDRQVPKGKR